MKRTILTLAIALTTVVAAAQKEGRNSWVEIEPAVVEVLYKYYYLSDTVEVREHTTQMFLRAGRTASMFIAPKNYETDSLYILAPDKFWANWDKYMEELEHFKIENSQPHLRTFKNYPEGQVTEFNIFAMDKWTYSEPWEKPQWELCNSTKQVLGYDCQLATSNYRGRTWLAWFTLDIPLSDGPWKLCGLPGLILEASDSKNHHSFTAIGIEDASDRKVVYYNKNNHTTMKVSHDIFYKTKYRSLHQSNVQNKLESLGIDAKVQPMTKQIRQELLETDYPH